MMSNLICRIFNRCY